MLRDIWHQYVPGFIMFRGSALPVRLLGEATSGTTTTLTFAVGSRVFVIDVPTIDGDGTIMINGSRYIGITRCERPVVTTSSEGASREVVIRPLYSAPIRFWTFRGRLVVSFGRRTFWQGITVNDAAVFATCMLTQRDRQQLNELAGSSGSELYITAGDIRACARLYHSGTTIEWKHIDNLRFYSADECFLAYLASKLSMVLESNRADLMQRMASRFFAGNPLIQWVDPNSSEIAKLALKEKVHYPVSRFDPLEEAVPHPSTTGYLDFLATPQSEKAGEIISLCHGVRVEGGRLVRSSTSPTEIYSSELKKAIVFPGHLHVHRQVMMRNLAAQMVHIEGEEPTLLVPEGTADVPEIPGLYANTAFMFYYGWNLEDACVISQSLAERLATYVLHTDKIGTAGDFEIMAQEGDLVRRGSVLVVCKDNGEVRHLRCTASVPGTVKSIEVIKSSSGGKVINIIVVTTECKYKCGVGDKISNMHASKSIISRILPDHLMPRCNGVPADLIVSPFSVLRRMAPSCVLEVMINTYLRELARRFGLDHMRLVVSKFDSSISFESISSNLEALGLPGDCMYHLTQPNGAPFPNRTLFGPMRIGRIMHHAPDKLRYRECVVTNHMNIPMRGKGNQRYGREELEVFIEHGASGIIEEVKAHRSKPMVDLIYDIIGCLGYAEV